MSAWTSQDAEETLELGPKIGTDVKCPLPRPDYYIHQDQGIGTDVDAYNLENDGPIARCMVENGHRVHVERNLYAHVPSGQKKASTEQGKPPTFVIFGKPGVGLTTHAKKIVELTQCVLINPETLTEYYQKNQKSKENLQGQETLEEPEEKESPSDSLLWEWLQSRIHEQDVVQRGYVLEGIPRLKQDADMDYAQQIEKLANLDPNPPEYIILIHMQDVDLFKRRSEQKVDTQEQTKYTRSQYTRKKIDPLAPDAEEPAILLPKKKRKNTLDISSDAAYIGLTSMAHSPSLPNLAAAKDIERIDEDMVEVKPVSSEVLLRLVTSEEDTPYNIESSFRRYREWLAYLQPFIDSCGVEKVLELNGYWASEILVKMTLEFFDHFGLKYVVPEIAKVKKSKRPRMWHEDQGEDGSIMGEDENPEDPEDEMDGEDFDDKPRGPKAIQSSSPMTPTAKQPHSSCIQEQAAPLFIVVTGPPKSGKSALAYRLAQRLGMIYVSQETMMDEIVKHTFANRGGEGEEYDAALNKLASGPQPMLMADEILAYLRGGHAVPPYMVCRVLDLALMAPRGQFRGAVFDDYPMNSSHLQELLERGVIPGVVVNLQLDLEDTMERCERHRFDPEFKYDTLLEECPTLMERLYEEHQTRMSPLLEWFSDEIQCLMNVDGNEKPETIYDKVTDHCHKIMRKHQIYLEHRKAGKPAVLDGTMPLSSLLHKKLTQEFRNFDPVAVNDKFELGRVEDYAKNLDRVVEYRDEIYVFENHKNVHKFIAHPEKYTVPTCEFVPPEIVPIPFPLTFEQMQEMEELWGFQDFDLVRYYEGGYQYKSLIRGDPQYCAEYNGSLYFFVSQENLNKFLRKPYLYTDAPRPAKFPPRITENYLDSVPPVGYLIATGLDKEIVSLLKMVAEKRPRFPFMTATESALLYMGYYLKSQDMKATAERREHYRKAMDYMTNTQAAAEKLSAQIEKLHGVNPIPPETEQKLNEFLALAEKRRGEKVVDPYIPDLPFSYSAVNMDMMCAEPVSQERAAHEELPPEDEEYQHGSGGGLIEATRATEKILAGEDYNNYSTDDEQKMWSHISKNIMSPVSRRSAEHKGGRMYQSD